MNKNTNKNKNKIIRANISLLSILVLCYLVNLMVANHTANKRYTLSQYRSQVRDLEAQTQVLSVQAAELQSSGRLMAESSRLNLVRLDSVRYIAPKAPVVLNQ